MTTFSSKLTYVVIAASSAVAASQALAVPTIVNPSFENPGFNINNPFLILGDGSDYITGWHVSNSLDYFKGAQYASDGQYSVNYIRGPGEAGLISTTITGLLAGTSYALSFDLLQTDPNPSVALTISAANASKTYINSFSEIWQRQTLTFSADGASTLLTLRGPQNSTDSRFAHVDNFSISIAAVPEPNSLSMMLFGLGLSCFIFRQKRGKANTRDKLPAAA